LAHDLPNALRQAIAEHTGSLANGLAEARSELTAGYRSGAASRIAMTSQRHIAAYLIARLPATYAAVAAALERLAGQWSGFAPKSLFDAGCGPGTGLFAALVAFPSLDQLAGLDRDAALIEVARDLVTRSGLAGDRPVTFTTDDLARPGLALAPADLINCTYALVECDEDDIGRIAATLFAAARQALVLVEPGTPAGFERLRAARTALIGQGAQILAPCPHQSACPITAPDWCHFSVRLARSRDHRRLKDADAPFEDEKFSYLIAARAPGANQTGGRILRPPRHGKAGSRFDLCTDAGNIQSRTVPARDRTLHRSVRDLVWGDFLPEVPD